MGVVKIYVYPADRAGCGHYRLLWPGEVLKRRGLDVEIMPSKSPIWMQTSTRPSGRREAHLVKAPECDVLILQRCMDWRWQHAIPQMRAAGIRVVMDIDDDLHALRGDHVGFLDFKPGKNPDINWENMLRAADECDLVTATTQPILDRYARNTNGVLLPNCIPAPVLAVDRYARAAEGVLIGWSGSTDTHPGDLDTIHGIIPRVLRRTGADFGVLGNAKGVRKALGLREEPVHMPRVPIADYYAFLAQFDIGVAPLLRHSFNAAKSWLKPLEFAACGVPCVAAATPEYLRAEAEGLCVTAANPAAWDAELSSLASSEVLRYARGEAARHAARRWTIEAHAREWAEAWTGSTEVELSEPTFNETTPSLEGAS